MNRRGARTRGGARVIADTPCGRIGYGENSAPSPGAPNRREAFVTASSQAPIENDVDARREAAQARFAELRTARTPVADADLDAVWADLDTIRPADMLGRWHGGEFVTGHAMNGLLTKIGWYGKNFISTSEVQPLVCRNDAGELYSNTEVGKGEASLWAVEFRGEVTASMVYDGQPVIDHFKRVNDTTVMGIMNGSGGLIGGRHFYFYLERDS